ncbi:MAG: peptidyl-prolyl cis-trans isomerase, partial [Faecalibacterium prausnitzii]|nr:peptidyl-prolyl cis-trans isomerase [Faecalibacterium prausnitzii]
MKLKKLFALALAGVMTLALLTGCGDKPGDKPEDTLRAEALADIINV